MEALSANTLLIVVVHRKIVSQNSKEAAEGIITLFIVSNSKGFKQIQKTYLSTLHMEPILTNFVSNLKTYNPSTK
jgi:hypothetical protein